VVDRVDPEAQYRAALSNLEEAITDLCLRANHGHSLKATIAARGDARVICHWIEEAINYKVAALRLDIFSVYLVRRSQLK
jgi:hypothetical protein